MNISAENMFVFLGPSLPLSTAESILQATYLPPVKQGDLLQLVTEKKPKVIGIIDGLFMGSLSIWHKEILYALSQGIAVFGASSMGALRAAEMSHHGMVGVGTVFELYHSKEVDADDEVALIHGGKEDGYTPFSLPLINLRITINQARRHFPQELCEGLLQTAKGIYYPDRTWENLKKRLPSGHHKLLTFAQNNYIDQKREDASALLHRLKNVREEDFPEKFAFPSSQLFDILNHYNRRISLPPVELTEREIGQYIALHHSRHAELQFRANNQVLATLLARLLNVEASEEEIVSEQRRFLQRHQLQEGETLNNWLKKQHLSEDAFRKMMRERAVARKVQNSHLLDVIPWKKNQALLDELKWQNEYETWVERAKNERELMTTPHFEIEDDILEKHMQATEWSLDTEIDKWVEEANFESLYELKTEMQKYELGRERLFQAILSSLTSE